MTIIFAAFFGHAFAGGGIFTRIPDIQLALALNETVLGLALTTASVGGLLANLAAGRIVAAIGTKPLMVWGTPLLALASAAVALAPGLVTLFPAILLMGVCFSLVNVSMNVEADRIESTTGRRIMNRCHGIWSIGMLAAALVGVGARAGSISAPVHLLAVVPFMVALTVFALARLDPSPLVAGDPVRRPGIALPSRRTVLLMLFGVSAPIAQSGVQNWSVIFMRDNFSAPDWIDTLSLPAFLIAMSLGRLFADGWTERFGPARVAFVQTVMAMAGTALVVGATGVVPALAGFLLMGAGTAVLFPLMISAAARSGERPAAESVSAVILATGLVMLLAPAVMGWVAETQGLRVAFATLALPMVVTLGLIRMAAPVRPVIA